MGIYEWVLKAGDICFGWTLSLPSDLTIASVAVMTSIIFLIVRRLTTDQKMLRCCKADKKRLKELIAQAKSTGDKEAIVRYRATIARIGMKTMRAEIKPALLALTPVAFLATWSFERLDYCTPRVNDELVVSISHPISCKGHLVHLVPSEGLNCDEGWIRRFESDGCMAAVATWRLRLQKQGEYNLLFRSEDGTFIHPLAVGLHTYSSPQKFDPRNTQIVSSLTLKPRQLLGIVPGIPWLGLAPWMAGYLLMTMPLIFVSKAVFRVE